MRQRLPHPWGAPLPTDALDFAMPRPGMAGQIGGWSHVALEYHGFTCYIYITDILSYQVISYHIYIYKRYILNIYIYIRYILNIYIYVYISWFFVDQSFEADSVPGSSESISRLHGVLHFGNWPVCSGTCPFISIDVLPIWFVMFIANSPVWNSEVFE